MSTTIYIHTCLAPRSSVGYFMRPRHDGFVFSDHVLHRSTLKITADLPPSIQSEFPSLNLKVLLCTVKMVLRWKTINPITLVWCCFVPFRWSRLSATENIRRTYDSQFCRSFVDIATPAWNDVLDRTRLPQQVCAKSRSHRKCNRNVHAALIGSHRNAHYVLELAHVNRRKRSSPIRVSVFRHRGYARARYDS